MTSSPQEATTRGPLIVAGLGLAITIAAFVALVVAGAAAADLYPATGSAAQAAADGGLLAATQAWANPLALTGIAVLLALAVPYALINIRSAIGQRRDAMVTTLPALISSARIQGAHR